MDSTQITPLPSDPRDHVHLSIMRQGLLAQVDAIEQILNMPRTSEMRKFAKEMGFYAQADDKEK